MNDLQNTPKFSPFFFGGNSVLYLPHLIIIIVLLRMTCLIKLNMHLFFFFGGKQHAPFLESGVFTFSIVKSNKYYILMESLQFGLSKILKARYLSFFLFNGKDIFIN